MKNVSINPKTLSFVSSSKARHDEIVLSEFIDMLSP